MKYSKLKKNTKFIESLLNDYNENSAEDADKINKYNEKVLSKELKNIIKNNNHNIKGSGSVLKKKPIDTSKLLTKNV